MKRREELAWLAVHLATVAGGTELMAHAVDANDHSSARVVFLVLIGTGMSFGWLARGAAERWRNKP